LGQGSSPSTQLHFEISAANRFEEAGRAAFHAMQLFSTAFTGIHSFAQSSRANFIDAANENFYLAPQIEPAG
jgi:hypothetical protein